MLIVDDTRERRGLADRRDGGRRLTELNEAIEHGQVEILFQPQFVSEDTGLVGAEALARWTHPEKGPIAASEFVAAAEQHDRIGKLTDFVLEKAVAAAAEINRHGYPFTVAVNLSARLLTDKHFTMRVAALLARHSLPARFLTLELTETAALADNGESLDMLTRLRELGIGLSIDDYGTGLSTLDYLKKIPANEIKIDQSFVKSLCDNRSDRLMVQSTVGLAHSLEWTRRDVARSYERLTGRELEGSTSDRYCCEGGATIADAGAGAGPAEPRVLSETSSRRLVVHPAPAVAGTITN